MELSQLLLISLSFSCVVGRYFTSSTPEQYCYAHDLSPFMLFATKTPYDISTAQNSDEIEPESKEGCHPVQFWLLSRHATRYPSADDIEDFNNTLPELRDAIIRNHEEYNRGLLCEDDLLNLKTWDLDIPPGIDADLTESGEEELFNLANRYQGRYPSLLNKKYVEEDYVFRVTTKIRTYQSALAFSKGLFGNIDVNIPEPIQDDPILRYYKNCDAYQRQDDDPNSMIEYSLFTESDLMNSVLNSVSLKLGFQDILPFDTVKLVYDMCRYNKAWDVNSVSPWCAAFLEEELSIMEYAEDLKNYYESGYGHELNIRMGCPPIKDMIDHFRQLNDSSPLGILYFTHSTLLQLFSNRLGISKDIDDLRHDNYEAMRDRQWRLSLIGPFSTNMVAVYHECEDEPKVEFFFLEKPFRLPGCEDYLCPWRIVEQQLADVADNCDITEICK